MEPTTESVNRRRLPRHLRRLNTAVASTIVKVYNVLDLRKWEKVRRGAGEAAPTTGRASIDTDHAGAAPPCELASIVVSLVLGKVGRAITLFV